MDAARRRHERTLKHIRLVESKVPAFKRIWQHPRYKHCVPPIVAALEVAVPILIVLLPPTLVALPLPAIHVPLPRIDWPDITVPSIPFPDFELPTWLREVLYWGRKTGPIWIAMGFAVIEIRRHRDRHKRPDLAVRSLAGSARGGSTASKSR